MPARLLLLMRFSYVHINGALRMFIVLPENVNNYVTCRNVFLVKFICRFAVIAGLRFSEEQFYVNNLKTHIARVVYSTLKIQTFIDLPRFC